MAHHTEDLSSANRSTESPTLELALCLPVPAQRQPVPANSLRETLLRKLLKAESLFAGIEPGAFY